MKIELLDTYFPSGKSLILNTMRIALLLFFTTSFGFTSYSGLSQEKKVTLNTDELLTVEEVFDLIEEQTPYRFVYPSEVIKDLPEVEVKKGAIKVKDLLADSFSGTTVDYAFRNKKNIVLFKRHNTNNVVKQQMEVSGTVTDEHGVPLPGVNILVKGSNKGTTTSFEGDFSIKVKQGDVLVFSYLGFTSEEFTVEKDIDDLQIRLKESKNELSEVVLTGYNGKTTKEQFTGALTKVNTDILKTNSNISIGDALIGTVPGMLVKESFQTSESEPTILLRGVGSINSSTQPLFIVDGVQLSGGLDRTMLNSNDIKDITVLKDAAATSIYGSKGTNGVILITTKRGKRESNLQVAVNSTVSLSYPSKRFTSDLMNSQQNLDYQESIGVYEGREDILEQRRNSGNDVNWADLLLENGATQRHEVSISGGTKKINYYTSLSYDKEDNQYGAQYNRTLATVKMDYDILKNLSIGVTGSYGQRTLNNTRINIDPYGNSFLLNPWENVYDDDGNYTKLLGEGVQDPPYNPLFKKQNEDSDAHRKNMMGNINIKYSPLDWLTLNGMWAGNYNTNDGSDFQKVALAGGKLEENNSHSSDYTANLTVTADKHFDKHHITLLLGSEVKEAKSSSMSISAKGYLNNSLRTITAAQNPPTLFESKTQSGSLSYFSRLDYDFNKSYNFSASFRRDGSSRFGSNNRYGNFWSLGAGWNIKRTLLSENKDNISNLRVRASIGTSGNDFIGDFDALSLYEYRKTYLGVDVPTLSRAANPNLTWEKNQDINFGIDYGFFDNRIEGSVDYYIRDTKDLLSDKPLSYTTGFENLTANIGKFRNQGIEVSLNTINVQSENFRWNSTINFSYNKGEVKYLNDDEDLILRGSIAYKAGSPINALYLIDWVGVNPENGLNQYRTKEGEVIEYDTQDIINHESELNEERYVSNKTSAPKYFGGFRNTLSYKNIDLSFLFSFSGGNYVFNSGKWRLYNESLLNQHVNLLKAWKNPGDKTDIAVRSKDYRFESDYQYSTQFLQKGDYIKLKTLTLGYNFNPEMIDKIGFSKLRVYAQAQNVFAITQVDYTDPEYSTLTGGIGLSSSMVRKFTLGIELNF